MSDEEVSFKVTDRRLFNADGSPRDLPPEQKSEPKPVATETEVPSAEEESIPLCSPLESNETAQAAAESTASEEEQATTSEEDDVEIPDANDPASFANFMMQIASNAASSLGMMEHPVTHKREVDLELGKHWTDVLGMLERKTRGNLTAQEKQIMESLLADLRMQYVSLTSTASVKTAQPFSGKDIIGG